jgi:hypothetical protein
MKILIGTSMDSLWKEECSAQTKRQRVMGLGMDMAQDIVETPRETYKCDKTCDCSSPRVEVRRAGTAAPKDWCIGASSSEVLDSDGQLFSLVGHEVLFLEGSLFSMDQEPQQNRCKSRVNYLKEGKQLKNKKVGSWHIGCGK